MSVLYIIQGFLGAGKTTYSKALSQKTKAVRLNADEWCDENFPPEKLSSEWDACFADATKTLWGQAEKLLKNGQSVILDFGFWSKDSRNHAREKAREWGVECEHHYVFAPDDVLLERIKKRSGGIAEKNIQNFSTTRRFFEEPTEGEHAILIENYSKGAVVSTTNLLQTKIKQ